MADNNWPILALRKSGMSLEDVFIRLTAGDSAAAQVLAGSEEPSASAEAEDEGGEA
jgi:hypothetical protein